VPTKETPGTWWRDVFFSGRAATEYNWEWIPRWVKSVLL
jgi:hypothetical protein